MKLTGGRLGPISIFIIAFTLACLISAGYYYFQIKSNEKYQNQLHFREIKTVTKSLDSGILQLKNIGHELERNSRNLNRLLKTLADYKQVVEQSDGQLQHILANENKIEIQLQQLNDEFKAKDAQLSQAIKDVKSQSERLKSDEQSYHEIKSYFDDSKKDLDLALANQNQTFDDWFNKYCRQDSAIEFCQYVKQYSYNGEQAYETYHSNYDSKTNEIPSNFLTSLDEVSLVVSSAEIDALVAVYNKGIFEKIQRGNLKLTENETLFPCTVKNSNNGPDNNLPTLLTIDFDSLCTALSASFEQYKKANMNYSIEEELYNKIVSLIEKIKLFSQPLDNTEQDDLDKIKEALLEDYQSLVKLIGDLGDDFNSDKAAIENIQQHLTSINFAGANDNLTKYLNDKKVISTSISLLEENSKRFKEKLDASNNQNQEKFFIAIEKWLFKVKQIQEFYLAQNNIKHFIEQNFVKDNKYLSNLTILITEKENYEQTLKDFKNANNKLDQAQKILTDEQKEKYDQASSSLELQYKQLEIQRITIVHRLNNALDLLNTKVSQITRNQRSFIHELRANKLRNCVRHSSNDCSTRIDSEIEILDFGHNQVAQFFKYSLDGKHLANTRKLSKDGSILNEFDNGFFSENEAYLQTFLTKHLGKNSLHNQGFKLAHRFSKDNQNRVVYGPIDQLLKKSSDHFPLLLLSDNKGKLIARHDTVQKGVDTFGLEFINLNEALNQLFIKYSPNIKPVKAGLNNHNTHNRPIKKTGMSGFVDIDIGGIEYRLFISPYNLDNHDSNYAIDKQVNGKNNHNQIYVIGFKPKTDLNREIFKLDSSAIVIIIMMWLFGVAVIPLLKLFKINNNRALLKSDRRQLTLASMLMVVIISIVVTDTVIYTHFKASVEQQLTNITVELRNHFYYEVDQLIDYAKEQKAEYGEELKIEIAENSESQNDLFKNIYANDERGFFVESLNYIGEDGIIKGEGLWATQLLYRFASIDVSDREYFKRVNQCHPKRNNNICSKPLFLQRIFNLRDGRTTTQIAQFISAPENKLESERNAVLSFGSKINTFFSPVLPQFFGFMVFDNHTGDVLYHEKDTRSLIENAYVETDNNTKLRSLAQELSNKNIKEPRVIDVNYKGDPHQFAVLPLNRYMPWSLVVYYQSKYLSHLNFILIVLTLLTVLMVALLVVGLFLILKRVLKIFPTNFWWSLLWFDENVGEKYKIITIEIAMLTMCAMGLGYGIGYGLNLFALSYQYLVWFYLVFVVFLTYYVSRRLSTFRANKLNAAISSEATNNGLFDQYFILELKSFFKFFKLFTISKVQKTKQQQSISYFVKYLWVLLMALVALPAVMITIIVSGYTMQKYADTEVLHFLNAKQHSITQRHRYHTILLASRNGLKDDNKTLIENVIDSPLCFYGKHEKVNRKQLCGNKSPDTIVSSMNTVPTLAVLDKLLKINPIEFELANRLYAVDELKQSGMYNNKQIKWSNYYFYQFMKNAIIEQFDFIVIGILLLFLVIPVIKHVICIRLIGLEIPDNFRLDDTRSKADVITKVSLLIKTLKDSQCDDKPRYVQVIRPSRSFNRVFKRQAQEIILTTQLPIHIDELVEKFDDFSEFEWIYEHELSIDSNQKIQTVWFKGLELVALNEKYRIKALNVLEFLIAKGNINIILLSEVAPLYRLTRQNAYPCGNGSNEEVDGHYSTAFETARWATIMNLFSKLYNWTPETKHKLEEHSSLLDTVNYEGTGWPELKRIKHEFFTYHFNLKDPTFDWQHKTKNERNQHLKNHGETSLQDHWQEQQIVDFFSANAGALYRLRWEMCTKNERLLLIQMAHGATPNPQDFQPLEHLMRRNYIYRDNGWHIVNESFRQFVLSAEDPELVNQWMEEANRSPWRYWQIFILTMVMVVFGFIAYSATEHLNSVVPLLTAVIGLVPMLLRGQSIGASPDNSG